MSITLTKSELESFSGFRRPKKQIEWLLSNGIRHFVGGDGHPRVLLADLSTKHEVPRTKRVTPNFKALGDMQ